MSTLVVAEHLQGVLRDVTQELVTAAADLGEPVTVAVVANDPAPLVEQVNVPGVTEIVAVSAGGAEFEADAYQSVIETLIDERNPGVILTGFTVNSMSFGPALAVSRELGFASDVFALRREAGGLLVERAFYGGKVHAELEFPGSDRVLLLLRPTMWTPAEGPGTATVTELSLPTPTSRSRHLAFEEAPAADVDITTAEFLLSIGRGVGERESIEMFEDLAERMGAVLGVSRPIVDAGWMPASRQVGQSGKTVKPKVYLALGISGAIQHLAGMKTSGTIIAVNTDPEASIFGVAHYGAVADMFDIAEELEKLY
jgi:electron transfer flavoprotein alpha subunit